MSFKKEEHMEYPECPECESRNVKTQRTYENSDADGRRGMWVRYIECRKCGYEGSWRDE